MSENKAKKSKEDKKANGGNKGNLFKIIIVVVLVILLVAVGVVGGMVISKNFFNNENVNNAAIQEKQIINEQMYEMSEFLVNLADDGGRRYLKISISLGHEENKDFDAELEQNRKIIRDSVGRILRSKTTDDMNVSNEENIKTEIKDAVNELLTKGEITNVYFPDILIQ